MPKTVTGHHDSGFTMMELIVSVGLMVMLLSVLAFVFRQSAEAVSQATEAVNTVQKARNFEARMGRELAAAVPYVIEDAAGGSSIRAFRFDEDGAASGSQGNPDAVDYTTSIEFVSRTLQDGALRSWDVKYVFVQDEGERYGAIKRLKDTPGEDGYYVLWDLKDEGGSWDPAGEETLVWPVEDVKFEAASSWSPTLENSNDENIALPPYVRVSVTFLDSWGGESFRLPMVFYFPIYRGD